MKKILIRGPLLTNSGYGVHSRQIAQWVLKNYKEHKITTQLTPWGITPWHVNPDGLDGLVGQIMGKSSPFEGLQDVSIQIQLPNEWDPSLAKVNIGVTAGVETDRCNPDWVKAINKMTCVVVPSNFTKKTFEKSGEINVPVYVIPESFYHDLSDPEAVDLDNLDTSFNFLMFGQLTNKNPDLDRKNIFYGLKWLCEEFKNDPDVGIILKTNHGTNSKIDKRIVENLLGQLLKEIRPGPYPKIHLLHGNMSQKQLSGLYRNESVKALFAPTKGEGWGLPILESAACGLPVIATKYSGHMDFMSKGRFIELEYDLINVPDELVSSLPNIFVPKSKWAQPKNSDVSKKLKKFRYNSSIPKEWARKLAVKIGEEFSQDAIENYYTENLSRYFE